MAATPQWEGSWQGKLMGVRLVFNISAQQDSHLRATFDSPDQGATDIAVDTVINRGDTIEMRIRSLKLTYKGRVQPGDSMISGTLTQGMSLRMNLYRTSRPQAPSRPQTPQPPYPYDAEDVSWQCDGMTLDGTLTMPRDKKPDLGIVLLNGSGRQDRDGTVQGHKTMAVLAHWLTRHGYATLRYDDQPRATTSQEEEELAMSAVDYMRTHTDVKRVALLGHSLGAIEALHIAAQHPGSVGAVMALSAPVRRGRDVMIKQNELVYHQATGGQLSPQQRQDVEAIFTAIDSIHDTKALREALTPHLHGDTAQLATLTSPAYTALVRMHPDEWLAKIKCPVLGLWGTDDVQVDGLANAQALKASLPKADTQLFEATNHLLQPVDEPAQRLNYVTQPLTMRPEVLEALTEWLSKHK